jgi:hypothetical protein
VELVVLVAIMTTAARQDPSVQMVQHCPRRVLPVLIALAKILLQLTVPQGHSLVREVCHALIVQQEPFPPLEVVLAPIVQQGATLFQNYIARIGPVRVNYSL